MIWVSDLFQERSNLCLFWMMFCAAFPSHDRMCLAEQLLKFGPVHMGWILTVVMWILNDIFGLENLRQTHSHALTMADQSQPLGPATLQIHSNGLNCRQCVRMLGWWRSEACMDLFQIRFKGLSGERCHRDEFLFIFHMWEQLRLLCIANDA